MSRPIAMILAAPGTNRDGDVGFALDLAGAATRPTLFDELVADVGLLDDVQMLVIAGGFSYADALGAGQLWALQLHHRIGDALHRFVAARHPVIGICNGFQALTRVGLLPGALAHNADGQFVCRWVGLAADTTSHCVWTAGVDRIECPVAHGEGRFVHHDPARLAADGQVALRYDGLNPNGSIGDIAGVCDPTGVVLGLMPHPENHVTSRQHPLARQLPERARSTSGLALFEQGVRYAKEL